MERKAYISKSIAALLCIVTMVISFNTYLSYKNLYVHDNLPRDSIIYVATAKISLKNSTILTNNPSIQTGEIAKIKSEVDLYKEDSEKKIFTNILILFLSFISLASVHNFTINKKEIKEYNLKNLMNASINKNHNKKLSSSLLSEEGAK